MLGTIVLLLVIGAVLYLLWANDKLNTNSLNESSGQSDSMQFHGDDNKLSFDSKKAKSVRIAHGNNNFSKVIVLESPTRYDQIVERGDRVDANTVFMGLLEAPFGGVEQLNRTTNNFVIKQFKNMFIVFKGLKHVEIDSNGLMVRFEGEDKMVYVMIDASNSTIPELLRDVHYPICVLTNNPSSQLVLKEWGYTQVNDAGTLFVKNEKSFRIQ